MRQTILPSFEASILARLMIGAEKSLLSQAAAKAFLSLELSRADKERMQLLVAKSRAGDLTTEEESEVEAYSRISSFLGILKSKARQALKRHETKSNSKFN